MDIDEAIRVLDVELPDPFTNEALEVWKKGELRASFRRMVKVWHPDRGEGADKQLRVDKTRQILSAYELLRELTEPVIDPVPVPGRAANARTVRPDPQTAAPRAPKPARDRPAAAQGITRIETITVRELPGNKLSSVKINGRDIGTFDLSDIEPSAYERFFQELICG